MSKECSEQGSDATSKVVRWQGNDWSSKIVKPKTTETTKQQPKQRGSKTMTTWQWGNNQGARCKGGEWSNKA